ncbi:hypothetical protein C8Q79DRAFT_172917 [Trametes meyenii]|nr:hypothetical protein C8Q79DRAFT_172917 [Trametes meyenii]
MPDSVPTDEREPLLNRESQVEAGEASAPPEKKRSWWTIGWYAVLTILGAVALALFIKAFVEADDVELVGDLCGLISRCVPRTHQNR